MNRKIKIVGILIFLLAFLVGLLFVGIYFFNITDNKYVYPVKFDSFVEKYSTLENIDKNLIYGIINTESGFDENALSNVGASGLMQIMPDTFDWIKFKKNDERDLTFEDMSDPEINIEYGTFLISYLYERFGSVELAAAAYHAGMTQVDNWLKDSEVSPDGETIEVYPSDVTGHYVNKVMDAYEFYTQKENE